MKRATVVFPSTARTATPTPVVVPCSYARGLHLVIDVTAIALTPSVTPLIEARDEVSGKFYPLLTGAALTAVGTTVLKVYPGIPVLANVAASDILTEFIRVSMTHADADSITYSVAAHLVG